MSANANGNNSVQKQEIGQGDSVAPVPQPSPNKGWVHFDEENAEVKNEPAVIATESVQVTLERSISSLPDNNVPVRDPKNLRNVELPVATVEPIRQGFCKYLFTFFIILLRQLLTVAHN